jgi:hypothetical protein
MRILVIFSFFFTFIFALDKLENKSLIELFKGNYFSYICMHRWDYINKYNLKDEKKLSLVAYSCLKKNYLTPALDLSKVLRVTKIGRNNAAYINTLYLMKISLIRYIKDDYNLSYIKIPQIEDNLLAKIFKLAKKQNPIVNDNSFTVKDNDFKYVVFFKEDINNIIINIYKNNKLIKKVKFW